MAGEPQAHAFARGPFSLLGHRGEEFGGEIQAFEQARDVKFFDIRIFEQGEKGFFVRFVEEGVQIVTRCRACALQASGAIVIRHEPFASPVESRSWPQLRPASSARK